MQACARGASRGRSWRHSSAFPWLSGAHSARCLFMGGDARDRAHAHDTLEWIPHAFGTIQAMLELAELREPRRSDGGFRDTQSMRGEPHAFWRDSRRF